MVTINKIKRTEFLVKTTLSALALLAIVTTVAVVAHYALQHLANRFLLFYLGQEEKFHIGQEEKFHNRVLLERNF